LPPFFPCPADPPSPARASLFLSWKSGELTPPFRIFLISTEKEGVPHRNSLYGTTGLPNPRPPWFLLSGARTEVVSKITLPHPPPVTFFGARSRRMSANLFILRWLFLTTPTIHSCLNRPRRSSSWRCWPSGVLPRWPRHAPPSRPRQNPFCWRRKGPGNGPLRPDDVEATPRGFSGELHPFLPWKSPLSFFSSHPARTPQ